MSKKSDDSIERFFKKAVAQQDLSHLDADWKNMEKMLDDRAALGAGAGARVRRKFAFYSAVAILFLAGMYLAIDRPWEHSRQHVTSENKEHENKASQAAAGMLGPLSGTKESPTADLLFSTEKANAPVFENEHASDKTTHTITRTDDRIEIVDANVPSQVRTDVLLHPENSEPSRENGHQDRVGILQAESLEGHETVLNQNESAGPVVTSREEEVAIDSVTMEKETAGSADPEDAANEDRPPGAKVPTRWSVALGIAPDFSSTSVGRYSAPGTAYGLFVSYRFLPRWQVSTGLIKSAKQYEGYGDEYQPPPGYWENRTNGVIPEEVYGNCGIIEWPLAIRYDFILRQKSRFYVTTGVSSYLMRSESYEYYFAEDNPGAASGWTASKPTSYSFGVGHFSAGYERIFSNRLAVAVEPYFKMPFEAIGWSNIELHTTGAYLTVRYTFQKQTTQK